MRRTLYTLGDFVVSRSWPWRYGMAVVFAAAALGVRVMLDPWLGGHAPYVTFMVAVAATVWLAGFWPALLTAGLGVPAALALIIPSREPVDNTVAQAVGVSIYGLGMLAIALLGGSMQRARAAAQATAEASRLRQIQCEQEVVERRRAEEALQQAEARMRGIFENAAMGIVEADPDGKLTAANQRVCEILGYTPQELTGKTIYTLTAPQDQDRTVELNAKVRQGQLDRVSYEKRYLRRDGSPLWVNVTVSAVRDKHGNFVRAIGTVDDISERKAAEEALQKAVAELARSNQDLEAFAYAASHDLQEPLRMVVSYMDLLERRAGEQLDEKSREYIHFAADGGRRMQRLIDDLLAYSRVATKARPVVATSLDAAVERAMANLAKAIREAGAAVTHDHPLPAVMADETLMTQLLQNLIGNAVKFHDPSRPPRIHISARRQGPNWEVSVEDNGIGIPPEALERVFGVFQRLHSRSRYAGSGIGLATCKRIVERYGGRIWAQSTPGQGATFRFLLPAAQELSAAPPPSATEP
jgi:PAS domain S-box-containing protein